jgi:hypothetical protein
MSRDTPPLYSCSVAASKDKGEDAQVDYAIGFLANFLLYAGLELSLDDLEWEVDLNVEVRFYRKVT